MGARRPLRAPTREEGGEEDAAVATVWDEMMTTPEGGDDGGGGRGHAREEEKGRDGGGGGNAADVSMSNDAEKEERATAVAFAWKLRQPSEGDQAVAAPCPSSLSATTGGDGRPP